MIMLLLLMPLVVGGYVLPQYGEFRRPVWLDVQTSRCLYSPSLFWPECEEFELLHLEQELQEIENEDQSCEESPRKRYVLRRR